MKKTLNINIGNSIILIEEDAYEVLTSYLNEIKMHFAKSADDFEIVTDIENRIAEMFREILNIEQKEVITIEDVKVIVVQMGTVQDFEISEDAGAEPFTPPHTKVVKRLYRDTEHGIIAGVCAGLGHYLNVEELWIRIFVLLSIFAGGAGIIAYLVMWILVPRASSRSEKMYMKGEPVNLQNMIRNFQEEMADNHLIKRSGSFISEFVELLGRFLTGTGKMIFKVIAGFTMLISAFMLLSFIMILAAFLGVFDASANDIFPLSMVNESYLSTLLIAVFVCFAVPLLALILCSVRIVFNSRPVNKSVSFGLLIIWLISVGTGIFYIAKTSSEFKEHAEFTQVTALKPHAVYKLALDKSRFFSKEDSIKYQINSTSYKGRIILDGDEEDSPFHMPDNVRIRIEKSDDGKFSIVQNYSANGKTFDIALKHAQNIHYYFLQRDSLLSFSPKLYLDKNTNWRNQEVRITLKVPEGTQLTLNNDLDRYTEGYKSWACGHNNSGDYTEYMMMSDGLKCKYELVRENKEH